MCFQVFQVKCNIHQAGPVNVEKSHALIEVAMINFQSHLI